MPGKQERVANPKHDASYKNFFAQRRTVADTLRARVRDLVRHLDFSTLERMPSSFVTEALRQRHADTLWRIAITGGRWLYILILIEFQSTVDSRMALRMMEYTASIWKGLEREDLGPDGEYPFVLPIVIYNGEQRWTAAIDVADLLAPVPELLGYRPRHRYLLIEIQAEDPATLPPDNVLSMIARLEQARTAEDLEALVSTLPDWLGRIREHELAGPFLTWIMHVLTQRHGERGKKLRRKLRKEEEAKMTTLIERARKWGEERDQQWLQKGIEKGIEQQHHLLYRLVNRRFGTNTAERLLPLLDQHSDPESIAAIADAVIECETAEEFLRRVREV